MLTLPFVIALSAFFLLLWLADLYFTFKSTEKKGNMLEANPLMRALLRARRAHLYLFKGLEILCFLALVYFISSQNADYPVLFLLVAIAVYALVVSNGMAIYLQITKNHAVVARLFFLACLAALFFAYLAYVEYVNGTSLFNSTSKCCSDYAELKASCSPVQPITHNNPANSDINITVPG